MALDGIRLSTCVVAAVPVGVVATLVVDFWTLSLKRFLRIPSLSYCLVGRWFLHMPEGKFMHANIAAAAQKRGECAVGWIAHYAIGIAFAFAFLVLAPAGWLARPSLLPALLFGAGTVVIPLLVMQPAFGLGIGASRTPNPARARMKSLTTHLVFGLGLFIGAMAAGDIAMRVTHSSTVLPG